MTLSEPQRLHVDTRNESLNLNQHETHCSVHKRRYYTVYMKQLCAFLNCNFNIFDGVTMQNMQLNAEALISCRISSGNDQQK